ncbi:hypothetical protein BU26DRAFT_176660 [Trematosphaeria pertusa]|uniref:Uncharacterized protein n=1 Tax=Trematosphaeria pertusa TaxID=390896 RepID=A0A6A6HTK0_9PLEO|nr:uncharacterized protein BU26DRAFT_176660 [Trematosphaeria pertusa]KAF2241347.1 hypothetical protein BU26DRAFT_176660 [Trematosphaeria pertusa]
MIQYGMGRRRRVGLSGRGRSALRHRFCSLRDRSKLSKYVTKLSRIPKFQRNRTEPDVLFEAAFDQERGLTCDLRTAQEARQLCESEEVMVHYRMITWRISLLLMNSFPCLVICDYADSHQEQEWQPYAAAWRMHARWRRLFRGAIRAAEGKKDLVERVSVPVDGLSMRTRGAWTPSGRW